LETIESSFVMHSVTLTVAETFIYNTHATHAMLKGHIALTNKRRFPHKTCFNIYDSFPLDLVTNKK